MARREPPRGGFAANSQQKCRGVFLHRCGVWNEIIRNLGSLEMLIKEKVASKAGKPGFKACEDDVTSQRRENEVLGQMAEEDLGEDEEDEGEDEEEPDDEGSEEESGPSDPPADVQ